MTGIRIELVFAFLVDIAVWFGLYYLSAKSQIRRCQKEGIDPRLSRLRISYIIVFFAVHLFFLWLGYELLKWGGMD